MAAYVKNRYATLRPETLGSCHAKFMTNCSISSECYPKRHSYQKLFVLSLIFYEAIVETNASTSVEILILQHLAVLISVVTQRGVLAVRIAYGCLYYKDPAIFHLFLKYHK